MFRDDYDEWMCMECDRTWTTRSVPHTPECRGCGKGGWWQRFVKGVPYEVPDRPPEGFPTVGGDPLIG